MNIHTLKTLQSWNALPRKFVSVDREKLFADATARAAQPHEIPAWNVPGVHPESHMAFARHVFWWNVVNFAFSLFDGLNPDGTVKKFAVLHQGRLIQGAFAMGACFYRVFGENPIFAKDMQPHVASSDAMARFFEGVTEIPLLEERRQLLVEACNVLETEFRGDPQNIWEEGRFRAHGTVPEPGITGLLRAEFPRAFGSDSVHLSVSEKKALAFYFDKRANLAVLMYHDRAAHSGGELPLIGDIKELGPVPDYELPRGYVADGIFVYHHDLAQRIQEGKLISSGSQEEVEIRGATVWAQAMELLVINQERKKQGLPLVHIGHIDYYRWLSGKRNKALNHHLCKTTNY